ncbi:hypothetical protein [Xanthomonas phage Xp15]|uniref:Uncharacterized protein n=1 Tax=Xanthomonas phage Xp15 TaxID=322855 RepID=Q52PT1_9CAUD|nr:hypothetical protein XPXV15_gp80 [Xanthomonas phage Xp15]AAX84914.1 hypothetical protein [Xanthomonas phage Xp15]
MVSLNLPSSGALIGDTSSMVDPHKLGKVMWSRSMEGDMAPLDLHNQLEREDLMALNHVYEMLRAYRKIRPALQIVVRRKWSRMDLIKPYLIATMEGRSEAREMIASDDWHQFWANL